jgi:hypothetical protein
MIGRSRSRARWSVIARADGRAPLGRQRNRRSGSGDRAGSRLRVKQRRIVVSRNGDPDPKRVPARSGENVGRIQRAKENDQFPHALAPGGRPPVRKCGGCCTETGRFCPPTGARSRHLPRSSTSGASGLVSSVAATMAFSVSARTPLWPRIWNKIASYAFVYVLELRGDK